MHEQDHTESNDLPTQSVDSQALPESENPQHPENDTSLHDNQDLAPPGEHFDIQQTASTSTYTYPDQSCPAQSCNKGTKRKRCAVDNDDTDECTDATSGKSRAYNTSPESPEPSAGCSSWPSGSASSHPSSQSDSCDPGQSCLAQSRDKGTKRRNGDVDNDDTGEPKVRKRSRHLRRNTFKYTSCQTSDKHTGSLGTTNGESRDSDTYSESGAHASTSSSSPPDSAGCSYSPAQSDTPAPGCSSDDDIEFECPNSCLCRNGQPIRVRRMSYRRVVTPLYKKLLQHRATRRPNRKKYPCCDSYCSYRWLRRSVYEFQREYDESDLRVCHFSWGTWKDEGSG